MNESGVIGIILTVKWPYQEPEIVFHYPPSSFIILAEEHATIPIKECFGLECSKLAPLILPSDSILWDKISDLVIETKKCQHRFLFFPCFISDNTKSIPRRIQANIRRKNELKIEEDNNVKVRIESFSITLVLNASIELNYEFITESLSQFAKILLNYEITIGLISKETIRTNEITFEYFRNRRKLSSKINDKIYIESDNSKTNRSIGNENIEEDLIKTIQEKSQLAQKLVKFLINLKKDYNNITFRLKNTDICYYKESKFELLVENCDKYTLIIDNQKLSNIYNTNELIDQLIKIVDPHLSIKEISRELLESPENILNICHHLLSQGAATIIDVIDYEKIYIVVPEKIKHKMSIFNMEFNDIIDWRSCNPLVTICSFFCKGNTLSKVRDELIEFFQKSSTKKKNSKISIYSPYNSFNNHLFNSTVDEARKTTKSIVSWLAINNCIITLGSVDALNKSQNI